MACSFLPHISNQQIQFALIKVKTVWKERNFSHLSTGNADFFSAAQCGETDTVIKQMYTFNQQVCKLKLDASLEKQ